MSSRLRNFAMPLVFLGVLLFAFVFGEVIPSSVKSFLYALSLSIKECLIFLLPFVIFSLVFCSISKLGSKAVRYVLIILPLVCCSNFINTMLSYVISGASNVGVSHDALQHGDSALVPSFSFSLKPLVSNDVALFSGVALGLLCGFSKLRITEKLAAASAGFSSIFFKILVPLMPLFVAGTALKLQDDGVVSSIFDRYLPILFIFVASSYGIVLLQFFLLSGCKISKTALRIQNMIPAIVTAFGSMSSAAALPLSIKAAERNVSNVENARIIAPSTVNIHLVGDCFFIPMVAIAVMTSFGMAAPFFGTYVIFALHFVIAKFAVAAVPGGGVLVMLPIMQNYLGLSTDMLALVTALYILFDPLITTCNVAGNGAMAIAFDKVTGLLKPKAGKQ